MKVQRPDLLQEQMGVSRLIRHTAVKAYLQPDGKVLVAWGGESCRMWYLLLVWVGCPIRIQ